MASVRQKVKAYGVGSLSEEELREFIIGKSKNPTKEAALDRYVALAARKKSLGKPADGPCNVVNLDVVKNVATSEDEQMLVIALDSKNNVEGVICVGIGSKIGVNMFIPKIFREVIRLGCHRFVLVHNHPSGICEPSPEDVAFTKKIGEAARVLDICFLDHVIVGGDTYVSLRQSLLGPSDCFSG